MYSKLLYNYECAFDRLSADVSEGVNPSYYANVLHMRIILVANSSYYTNVLHIPTAHNDGNSVCIETEQLKIFQFEISALIWVLLDRFTSTELSSVKKNSTYS